MKQTPSTFAEAILSRVDSVPWPVTAFLRFRRNTGSFNLHTMRRNDPESDRLRKTSGYYEIGTYTAGAVQADIVADVLEVMGRAQ